MITDVHIEALETVLEGLLTQHESLVRLASRHRDALRAADGGAITELSLERDRVNAAIVELNEERVRITRSLTDRLGAGTGAVAMKTLIQAIAPERAGRLSSLAAELRSAVEASRREHSILRDATAMFAGQLEGVLNRAVEMCAPARTYTAAGRMSASVTVPSALDVRH
ncbi:MAG: flagellar export chaperone FlgN [Planctomycetota bacterium]